MNEEDVVRVLKEVLPDLDEEMTTYFTGIIQDQGIKDPEAFIDMLTPFIESYGLVEEDSKYSSANAVCIDLIIKLKSLGFETSGPAAVSEELHLLDKTKSFSSMSKSLISESEKELSDKLWGFDKIRNKRNETIELNDAGSAKYERKAIKEQKKWLEQLENKFAGGEEEENAQISIMTLPDLSGSNREKDIHVKNFNITFGGSILLEGADLRIVYGRRFGLCGRNGVGKTTLLRHMANFDIEGFPKHHRILHVKQEVKSSEMTVLDVVLAADVERADLLRREKELIQLQQDCNDAETHTQLSQELTLVYDRMTVISVDSAEARASSILNGLRFTVEMQRESTNKLSGGWKMRVALAGALFIEPDLLMLDEPTNHLDLEVLLMFLSLLDNSSESCNSSYYIGGTMVTKLSAELQTFSASGIS
jgi:ATP-binding cassette subfamily F protein 3